MTRDRDDVVVPAKALVTLSGTEDESVIVYIPRRWAEGDGSQGAFWYTPKDGPREKVWDFGTLKAAGYDCAISIEGQRHVQLLILPTDAAEASFEVVSTADLRNSGTGMAS